MKVRDVMHPDAVWLSPETPLPRVAAKMREEHARAVPISEYDRMVGMVTEHDLCEILDKEKAAALTAKDVMSKPLIYCYPEEDVEEALRIMSKHEVPRLTVVSHQKRVLGSLTLADIPARARATPHA